MSKKTVIVTGVGGQDGSLMVDYLLTNTDNLIIGTSRNDAGKKWISNPNYKFIQLDITCYQTIENIILNERPDYFLNFSAQTEVKKSWANPLETYSVNSSSIFNILEVIRLNVPNCRFLNVGSSEEFGELLYSPQDELHPINPVSPYGLSKALSRKMIDFYRNHYKLFAIQPWCFNHESTRRGKQFVTRKITSQVVDIFEKIRYGKYDGKSPIELGNLNVKRDWSAAEDCVDAMWKMINNNNPIDYVISSGNNHTIKKFVECAFSTIGIKGSWFGEGIDEYFYYESGPRPLASNECILVKVNPQYYRPVEIKDACGNSNKLKNDLKWEPKFSFDDIVMEMVEYDHLNYLFK